jgi:hypothetical protein
LEVDVMCSVLRCAVGGKRFHAAFAVAAILFAAGAASALPPCPTWFPDFRCDRHGRYEGFVPPMMHPYLFEDPFITTGISLWGLWHEFPDSSILEGGQLWDVALQARVAITDRIAFIRWSPTTAASPTSRWASRDR